MKVMTRIFAYARVSQDKRLGGHEGLAVARQLEECRAFASTHGLEISKEFIDNSVSATSGVRREAFEEMLEQKPDAIICWAYDRLIRVASDLEKILNQDITVYQVTAKTPVDLETPSGRMTARILTSFASYETEHKATRQKARNKQASQMGIYRGNYRPLGNYKDGRLHEVEAPLLREHIGLYLKGESSLYKIAQALNDAGILTNRGNKWVPATVRRALSRPRLMGYQDYQGERYKLTDWEPVLSEEDFELLQNRMQRYAVKDSPSKTFNTRQNISLLTGFLTCFKCGTSLHRAYSAGNHKRPEYKCPHGHTYISSPLLEKLVILNVVWMLTQAHLHDADRYKLAKASKEKAKKLLDEYQVWEESAIETGLSPSLIKKRQQKVQQLVEECEAEYTSIVVEPYQHIFEGQFAEEAFSERVVVDAFSSLDRESQRDLVRRFIRTIEVHPGTKGGHATYQKTLKRIKPVMVEGSMGFPYGPDGLLHPELFEEDAELWS